MTNINTKKVLADYPQHIKLTSGRGNDDQFDTLKANCYLDTALIAPRVVLLTSIQTKMKHFL